MFEQLMLFPEDPEAVIARQRKKLRNLTNAMNEEGLAHRDAWNEIYQQLSEIHKTDVKQAAENLEKALGKPLKPLDFIMHLGWLDEAGEIAAELLRDLRKNLG